MSREKRQSEFTYAKDSHHIPNPDIIYETDISDARWIAYDLPGNAGWMLYFAGLILAFAGKPAFMEQAALPQMMVVAVMPALLMLAGIIELVSERIRRLDRVLPRMRLWRGFGALTLGGALGAVTSAIMLILAALYGAGETLLLWLMLMGSILCGVFAGLLLRRYKKK